MDRTAAYTLCIGLAIVINAALDLTLIHDIWLAFGVGVLLGWVASVAAEAVSS